MSRRHRSSAKYNPPPPAPAPPAPAPTPPPAVSPISSLLSNLIPKGNTVPIQIPKPQLPVNELMSGISNTVRGLVLNDNWWITLLIIFLFFPKLSNRLFGGLFKD